MWAGAFPYSLANKSEKFHIIALGYTVSMPISHYAKKLHFLTIILLFSLAFSNLLPNRVTPVHAQAPETATPEAAITATPPADEAPSPTAEAPTGTATPADTLTAAPEDTATPAASPTDTPTAADSATVTPTSEAVAPTPEAVTPTPEAVTPTPPAPPAQNPAGLSLTPADYNLLSDGQFVYGPNVGSFTIADFTARSAPQLSPYADALYGRAEFNSINPRLYFTLMEMATGLVSNRSAASQQFENPFGLAEPGFLPQLDALSKSMFNAYYLHLYNFTALTAGQRNLPALTLADGSTFDVPGAVNAGSYAVLAGLASFKDTAGMAAALDSANPLGFAQTYRRLFPDDDPLSQANQILYPGQLAAQAAPANLLQFPYPRGQAWTFNGVHSNDGVSSDMSAIDFSNGWPAWGTDTSNMWVVASAGGTPIKISSCNFHIDHSNGWVTAYYHLDNIQNYSGSIQQNDRIGVIANNQTQALCNGGSSTGPHVHFVLRYNGALVAINGTALSGWVIHAGTYNYDYDHNDMWLIRDGVKKYAYVDPILNDATGGATCPAPALSSPADSYISPSQGLTFKWSAVSGCSFSGYTLRIKDTSDMDSGGNIIVDKSVSDTSQNRTIAAQWDDMDLYWGVQAANPANGAAWSVRHFQIPSPPNPPTLLSPAENGTIYSRQLTFTWQSPNAPNQNGYTLRLSVSSNPDTSPWLVNTSPGNSLTSYGYTFASDGTYYWHMRTLNTYGTIGAWVTRAFNVQGKPPGTPSLSAPAKNALLYVYTPTLDWSDATDADHYRVQVSTDSAFTPANLVLDTTVIPSTYPFTSRLPPNATYYWRIQAINVHAVIGAWAAYSYFRTALNPPALLYPANGGAALTTRPAFDWGDVTGNAGYAFQLSTLPSFSSKTVDTTVTASAYTMTSNLLRSRLYYWRVRANGSNQSAWSPVFSFTSANPPPIPSLLSPASNALLTNYAPTLDWNDVTGADHYRVQVATSSSFSTASLLYDDPNRDSSDFPIPGALPANATYYWRVCTFDAAAQYSLWTAYRTFRTAMTPPDLLLPANPGQALTTRPAFDWAEVNGATGYVLQVSASPVFTKLVVNTSPTGSGYTPGSDLPRNQLLYWRVSASGKNPSAWSVVFSFTSADPPAVPSLLAPADSASLSVYTPTLDWNDVANTAKYQIQVATSSSFSDTSLVYFKYVPKETSNFTPLDPLASNATFFWRVRAYNAAGQYSLWSSSRHFHTKLPATALISPGNAGTAAAPVTLQWGSVGGATGYTVQVSTSASFSSTVVNKTVTAASYTITSSLTKGKVYYWRVQAKGTYSSDWSAARTFTAQ